MSLFPYASFVDWITTPSVRMGLAVESAIWSAIRHAIREGVFVGVVNEIDDGAADSDISHSGRVIDLCRTLSVDPIHFVGAVRRLIDQWKTDPLPVEAAR